jgi:hypothetical protein
VVLRYPSRTRLDVEVGYTLIEVKKDLRVGRVLADAEVQLAGYVRTRTLLAARRRVAAPGKYPDRRRAGQGLASTGILACGVS